MGLSVTHLLVVLAIVVVVFGTKRLRNIGADLGGAIKGFRTAIKEGEEDKPAADKNEAIEGEVSAPAHTPRPRPVGEVTAKTDKD